jgi:hypothetical protein
MGNKLKFAADKESRDSTMILITDMDTPDSKITFNRCKTTNSPHFFIN